MGCAEATAIPTVAVVSPGFVKKITRQAFTSVVFELLFDVGSLWQAKALGGGIKLPFLSAGSQPLKKYRPGVHLSTTADWLFRSFGACNSTKRIPKCYCNNAAPKLRQSHFRPAVTLLCRRTCPWRIT